VVELSLMLGEMPECYREFLLQQGSPQDIDRIPEVSPGGRKLYRYQREDAAALYGRSWALWNDPGTGKTTDISAATWAMMRDGLTPGIVWIQPLQTMDQVQEELKVHWGIASAR